jgi:subtilase family serine protease
MTLKVLNFFPLTVRHVWLVAGAAVLAGCGGSQSSGTSAAANTTAADTTSATLQLDVPASEASNLGALPTFHVAPVLLDEPDDMDAAAADTSASFGPHVTQVPASLASLSTRRLTREDIEAAAQGRPTIRSQIEAAERGATPLASGTAVATYTPAQIRAAYSLPALPVTGTTLTGGQAAQLGAGQTVYIVDAMNNPNAAAELASFNQKFGLPTCTVTPIATNATLPLATASTSGCVLSVVYSTTSGSMTASAPAYDSGWSTEISLDVQWTHATVPLARIILIEAPDSSTTSLIAAVNLANSMGHGVVSMSFGAAEGSWTATLDSSFTAANMTYVASAGDNGEAVYWPAVSSHVLAVGGTTLTYDNGARSEIAWSSSGGGVSSYTARPTYQASNVPGMGTPTGRSVSDVSFNADPTTGQYIAVISPGSSTVGWLSAGGTSLSAPQWAGVLTIVNAQRAVASKSALGAPHSVLYGSVAGTATNYAGAFLDITKGSDGTCAACSAKAGYDNPTGLGTPNVASLLPFLTGASTIATAPVVSSGSISGNVGVALSFAVTATAADAVSYALSGAPAGMTINSGGAVAWASPVAGAYTVTVTATDTTAKLSGQGIYKVTIAAPAPPTVTAASISGTAGVAISHQISVTSPDTTTLALSGAPSGVTLSSSGLLSWNNPVQGTYTATVTAKDTKSSLSGQGTVKLSIAAAVAPVVSGASISGTTGKALSFSVSVTSANPVNLVMAGAPSGMALSSAGLVAWSTPVVGNYNVTVTATDPKTGLYGQGVYKVTIVAPGPQIIVTPITGTRGKAVSGTITLSDANATSISTSISGAPVGMTFTPKGLVITVNWEAPVTGKLTLAISATDSAKLTSTASLPITIN